MITPEGSTVQIQWHCRAILWVRACVLKITLPTYCDYASLVSRNVCVQLWIFNQRASPVPSACKIAFTFSKESSFAGGFRTTTSVAGFAWYSFVGPGRPTGSITIICFPPVQHSQICVGCEVLHGEGAGNCGESGDDWRRGKTNVDIDWPPAVHNHHHHHHHHHHLQHHHHHLHLHFHLYLHLHHHHLRPYP